jgi:selenocysteine lyase/cysteine desulfurase
MDGSRRADFEIARDEAYLNGGAISPLPRTARLAIDEAWDLQATPSRLPYEAFFEYPNLIRDRAGRTLGLPADEIAVTTSTSFGMMLLAQGLKWRDGDRVLLGPDEFPSNAYPWFALEARGVHVEAIGRPGQPATADDLLAALKTGGPVRALSIAAVHYPTGDVQPLAELADLLHAHDAMLVVDASQAAGAVAIDWRATGMDAMTVSGYKWLFGPYGTGIFWVAPHVRDQLLNVNGNWFAVEGARDLTRLMLEYPRRYERHGRMFDAGEVASYFNLSAFRTGLDLLLEVGVPAAERLHRALQDRAIEGLAGGPLHPVTNPAAPHRSPMLMLEPREGLDLAQLQASLVERRVSISLRAGRLRLSPGIWNDEADMDAFVAAVHAFGR